MNAIDIKNMNVPDRLQIMEALWNSFLTQESDIDSPQWHKDTLEERRKAIKGGKADFVSIKDLKASRFGLLPFGNLCSYIVTDIYTNTNPNCLFRGF